MIWKEILQHSILVLLVTREVLHERGFSKLKANGAKKCLEPLIIETFPVLNLLSNGIL